MWQTSSDALVPSCPRRKQLRKMQPYPPLGTLYAAAALLRRRHFGRCLRPDVAEPVSAFERSRGAPPEIVAIYEDDFNFVTKMCLTHMRELAWQSWRSQRPRAGASVIAHGSDATDHAGDYLRQWVPTSS